jgi:hypothetical protein
VERVGSDSGFQVRHSEFLSYLSKISGSQRSFSAVLTLL